MRSKIKSIIKKALGLETEDTYHQRHGAQANEILVTLEGKFGKTDPNSLKLAEAYALDVFGNAHYAPWLRVYTAVAGKFKEGWIPDNYYGRIVIPRIKGGYGKIGDLKGLSKVIFDTDVFPDAAYFVNGLFFSPNKVCIRRDDVSEFLFKKSEKIVFKVDSSLQGRGVFFFDKHTFDVKEIDLLGNGVFQEYIEQHPVFERFAPGSVATLRLTTAVDNDGMISVRACYLRIGRGDDTHVQSKSHVRVPINLVDGKFSREAYLTSWLTVEQHPDSNVEFAGNKVPSFAACVSTVTDLHKKMPFVRCVGWDVCVDKNEQIRVMEWNSDHNDIKFSEATQGPCFSDLGWEKFKP